MYPTYNEFNVYISPNFPCFTKQCIVFFSNLTRSTNTACLGQLLFARLQRLCEHGVTLQSFASFVFRDPYPKRNQQNLTKPPLSVLQFVPSVCRGLYLKNRNMKTVEIFTEEYTSSSYCCRYDKK